MRASLILVKIIRSLQKKEQTSQLHSDILEQDSFLALLTLIDPKHFQNAHLTAKPYWSYLHSIDNYLVQHFSLRVQRSHKLFMAETHPKDQLVALALFLALKTPLMEELVQIIEALDEETQTLIIELLKGIECNIQDLQRERNMQVRNWDLQVQNHRLDGQIEEALDDFNALKQELDLLEKQTIIKTRRQKQLRDEKIALLDKIGITQCAQYSTILQDAYDQQNELVRINQNMLRLVQDSKEVQKDLLQNMREKSIEISILEEQRYEWQAQISNSHFYHPKNIVQHQMLPQGSKYLQRLKHAQQKVKQLKLARSHLKQGNKNLQNLIKKKKSQLLQASRACQNISD